MADDDHRPAHEGPGTVAEPTLREDQTCRRLGYFLSCEALNEHILGDVWPSARTRLDMLEEAVELIRALHRGQQTDYAGTHYTVSNARIYTLPVDGRPVPIYVSGSAGGRRNWPGGSVTGSCRWARTRSSSTSSGPRAVVTGRPRAA
jgi:hypothetical protein